MLMNPCHYCKRNLIGGDNPYIQICHPRNFNNRIVACANNSECVQKCVDEFGQLEQEELLKKNSKCKNKKCGACPTKKDWYCKQCEICIQKCQDNINEHQKRINNLARKCNENYGTNIYCYFDDGGYWDYWN
jgi:hypothetical protein